jgi:EAL domain-containing protein (putative c-di-GMP-specific phosphodiesterase class I)
LRDFGVKVVLDDFGTGHGSLALLQRLPLDGVKIDRSFVSSITTDHRDRALVRGLLTMSQELGLSVVAEGVETQEQSDALMLLGCTAQQGYLFSGATDVVGLQDLLVRMPPDTSMSDAVATPHLRRR